MLATNWRDRLQWSRFAADEGAWPRLLPVEEPDFSVSMSDTFWKQWKSRRQHSQLSELAQGGREGEERERKENNTVVGKRFCECTSQCSPEVSHRESVLQQSLEAKQQYTIIYIHCILYIYYITVKIHK